MAITFAHRPQHTMTDQLLQLSHALKIGPQFATSLGYFLVSFSRCEEAMNHAIWALLRLQGHTGGLEVISSIRDFGQRMMLLNRLSKRLLPTEVEQKKCSKIISALSFLNDNRVDLVHGEFAIISSTDDQYHVMRTVTQQSTVNRRLSRYSSEFLADLALYAVETEQALAIFRNNFQRGQDQVLPSLDKRPERQPPPA